ncbi:MAG TPA: LysR family transcriptional regulator ArgP [Burkholderiaceae bacterium]|nr:LysR family transcriptional regulator ArgP [Burkholderiaceae bacterium]
MRLDTAQLAAFAAAARHGSFEAAAGELHVTRSAVSQRIKALEERVGQVLLRRSTPVDTTAAGEALLRYVQQAQLLEQQALRQMGAVAQAGAAPQISIVVNADSLATWFLPALAPVSAAHGALFKLIVEDQDHSAELLRQGRAHAAVTAEPQAVQGCRVQTLGTMNYLAVCSPTFMQRWFAGGVNADSLAAAPMLVFNAKDDLQHRYLRSITRKRIAPPQHCVPSSSAFLDLARMGVAWGMVPEAMAREALRSGSVIELQPGTALPVTLHWQTWKLQSELMRDLGASVRQAFAAMAGRA